MINKGDLVQSLEGTIKILSEALTEREEALRVLLYANEATTYNDLDDLELFKCGSELDDQIDTLKDLLDELKRSAVRIGAFKKI